MKKSIFRIQDQSKKKTKSKKKILNENSLNVQDNLNSKPLPPIKSQKELEASVSEIEALKEDCNQVEFEYGYEDDDEDYDKIKPTEDVDIIGSSESCTEASQAEDDEELVKQVIEVEVQSIAGNSLDKVLFDSERQHIEVEVMSNVSSGSSLKTLEGVRPSSISTVKSDLPRDIKQVGRTLEHLEVSGRQLVAPTFYPGRPKTTPEMSKITNHADSHSFRRTSGNNLFIIKSFSAPTSRNVLNTDSCRRASDSVVLKKKLPERHTNCLKAEKVVGKSARSSSMEDTLSVRPSSFCHRHIPKID